MQNPIAIETKTVAARIGERFRRARELAGLSQTEVAEHLGLAANTVSGWEAGERMPRAPEIRGLCEVYACTADFLLGRTESPTSLPVGELLVDTELVRAVLAAQTAAEVDRFVDWEPQMISFWQIVRAGTRVRTHRQVQALTVELTGHLRTVAPRLWHHFERSARDMLRRKRRWDRTLAERRAKPKPGDEAGRAHR